jgi:hypothetical protein
METRTEELIPARLGGRQCATDGDKGVLTHAVPGERDIGGQVRGFRALCGAKPGRRSTGWSSLGVSVVDCPRCLKRAA